MEGSARGLEMLLARLYAGDQGDLEDLKGRGGHQGVKGGQGHQQGLGDLGGLGDLLATAHLLQVTTNPLHLPIPPPPHLSSFLTPHLHLSPHHPTLHF